MSPSKPKRKKVAADVPAEIAQPEPQPTAPAASPRIRRDESNAKLSYANFFNVSSTREETALMFGMIQASPNPREEVLVEVSNRIVLTPLAAKRLQTMLGRVLDQYEARFGPLTAEAR
jgi:hypothetical protein